MHTQIVPGTLKNEFTWDTSEHQDISARIMSEERMGGGGEGGEGRKEKKNQINSEAGWQTLCPFVTSCHMQNKGPV